MAGPNIEGVSVIEAHAPPHESLKNELEVKGVLQVGKVKYGGLEANILGGIEEGTDFRHELPVLETGFQKQFNCAEAGSTPPPAKIKKWHVTYICFKKKRREIH